MAHRVAELIEAAEHASPEDAAQAERAATDLVLRIWEHRAGARFHNPPFRSYDTLFETLARLRGGLFAGGRGTRPDDPVLEVATRIDSAGADLIVAALAPAIREASEVEFAWEARSDHLPDDEQRRAIRTLKQLMRDLSSATDASATGADPVSGDCAEGSASAPADADMQLLRSVLDTMEGRLAELRRLLDRQPDL